MTDQVPEAARQLAGRLADAFEQDRTLAEQLNDCQDRLRAATVSCGQGFIPTRSGCCMTIRRRSGCMRAQA